MTDEKEKTPKEKDQEQRKQLALKKRYEQRITIAKNGREAFLNKDYITAVSKYNEYLGILAESKDRSDIFDLSPSMFNNKTQITEMLLISHVYWELARTYEMTPKLQSSFHKCLKQFVKFTINQPYQVLNSEMLRKYIKKNKKNSLQINALNKSYSQIHIQSKSCFIATHCFGESSKEIYILRQFKRDLLSYSWGEKCVEIYYRASSPLTQLAHKNIVIKWLISLFIKPVLKAFSKIYYLSKIN